MKRLNIRVPEDVLQFVTDAATKEAQRRGYPPKQQPPKGEVVSGIIMASAEFKEWEVGK